MPADHVFLPEIEALIEATYPAGPGRGGGGAGSCRPEQSGTESSRTLRWRETDSNPRSPLRETSIFEAPLVRHNLPASATEIKVPPPLRSVSGDVFRSCPVSYRPARRGSLRSRIRL
jgi:hypothetical protein